MGETVGEEHDDLTIVGPGHEGRSGGARWGRGLGVTAKKLLGDHGEEDVLVVASAQREHATCGIETKGGALTLERNMWPFEVKVEGEAMGGLCVRKEGGQADAVGDGEVVVHHRLVGIYDDLT